MTFPLLNITPECWTYENLIDCVIFDEFIYTDKDSVFMELYKDKLFCDCNGKIFKAVKKAELTEKWRNWLKFIPNIWKREIIFQPTGENWTVEELRNYLLNRVSELKTNEQTEKWKTQLKKAKNHSELIYG
ncbi:hypothetical protein [Leeuwenhoekiella palythoae]|uniref:Uncharacterized protein n=1 Tax=Leeuwenhoekiella palythoae TaxID=573501 RepID=A0A1M5YYE1_9FLAO|nr:hypothetical protein [Leeuwenhoekiella palythoae]RXG29662.1 hypothetical protein DSM01_1764 [Leeuwenhoekiella palythoae]SHI16950.1 hypothetical protein SAMN04487999_2488 [Leeuwenhoekiella palythoae]